MLITKDLNTNRILRGCKKVSLQSVINLTKKSDDYGLLTLQRNGTQGIDELLIHPARKQPNSPGAQYQIDGTRFNIPFLDSNGKPDLLILVVLLDVYSKKVVGHTLTESETFQSYFKVISQSITETRYLPAEILSDNLPSLKSKECLLFMQKLQRAGVIVRQHAPHNPSDKGSIESWFGIFGQLYLKKIPGYLGDGLKSKRKSGKANSDLIQEYKKKKNIRSRADLELLLQSLIVEYNSTYEFKNSTPNLLFANTLIIKGIKLDSDLVRYFLLKERSQTLTKAGFHIQVDGLRYDYLIYDDNLFLAYRDRKVIIRYDTGNMNKIYVYTPDSFFAIFELELHVNFPLARIEQTEEEEEAIRQFTFDRSTFRRKLVKHVKSGSKSQLDTTSTPLELISEKYDSKNVVDAAIKQHHFPQKKQISKIIKVMNNDDRRAEAENINFNISLEKMFYVQGSNKLIK
ncbi:MAG: Integrase catalytic region [Mucilaginibacter sp.]|nr:Integrase catalytic region [Mucilaginibacter sp.]